MTQTAANSGIALSELLIRDDLPYEHGVLIADLGGVRQGNVEQTREAFSEKWTTLRQDAPDKEEGWKAFQYEWYLKCYGYSDEAALRNSLSPHRVILDAGCGPGYKAAWLASLNPEATVVAMDLSNSIFVAAERYGDRPNLRFVKGDIAATPFANGAIDFISCDQVLHHTDNPPATLMEFARIIRPGGRLNTYVYARKSLPRELLDEHLREYCKELSKAQLWELSDQLTRLGRTLSELEITIDVPDIPALGIAGGKQDLQRFLYWNFIKCFWNPQHGHEASKLINFDWYAPSTAFRYTAEEFAAMVQQAGFTAEFLHSENACHTGRFIR